MTIRWWEETQTVRLLEPVRQSGRELVMRAVHTGRELRILCDGPEEMNAGLRAGERITVEKRVRVLLDAEAANPDAPDPWGENAAAWEALWWDCDIRAGCGRAHSGRAALQRVSDAVRKRAG